MANYFEQFQEQPEEENYFAQFQKPQPMPESAFGAFTPQVKVTSDFGPDNPVPPARPGAGSLPPPANVPATTDLFGVDPEYLKKVGETASQLYGPAFDYFGGISDVGAPETITPKPQPDLPPGPRMFETPDPVFGNKDPWATDVQRYGSVPRFMEPEGLELDPDLAARQFELTSEVEKWAAEHPDAGIRAWLQARLAPAQSFAGGLMDTVGAGLSTVGKLTDKINPLEALIQDPEIQAQLKQDKPELYDKIMADMTAWKDLKEGFFESPALSETSAWLTDQAEINRRIGQLAEPEQEQLKALYQGTGAVPDMAFEIAAGIFKGSPAALTMMYGRVYLDEYNRSKRIEGLDEKEAHMNALVSATAEVLPEIPVFNKLFTRMPGAKAAIRNAVATMVMEGGSEMVTEMITILDETLRQGKPFNLEDAIKRTRLAGQTGAVMGPLMTGGVKTAQVTGELYGRIPMVQNARDARDLETFKERTAGIARQTAAEALDPNARASYQLQVSPTQGELPSFDAGFNQALADLDIETDVPAPPMQPLMMGEGPQETQFEGTQETEFEQLDDSEDIGQFLDRQLGPNIPGAAPLMGGEVQAPTGPTRGSVAPDGSFIETDVDPMTVQVDSKAFQFKTEDIDAEGANKTLASVKQWNPAAAGIVMLWEQQDGTRFIVDGHQRLSLAKRLKDQNPTLVARVYREADGFSKEDMRVMAAVVNIAQNTGSVLDAAKIIREVNQAGEVGGLDAQSLENVLPKSGAINKHAPGLAKLEETAFMSIINGSIKPEYGALVGERYQDPGQQMAAIDALAKTQPETMFQAQDILEQMDEAGFQAGQTDMFGETIAENYFKERAKIVEAVARRARNKKAIYGNLVRNEGDIKGTGKNRLDSKTNKRVVEQQDQLLSRIGILARSNQEISNALNTTAEQLGSGTLTLRSATDAIERKITDYLEGGGTIPETERRVSEGRRINAESPVQRAAAQRSTSDQAREGRQDKTVVYRDTKAQMVAEARRWKGAALQVARSIDTGSREGQKAAMKHSRMTTKGDLDAYLMKRFGVDDVTARDVSNELTEKNIKPDETANIEDFKAEPWYENQGRTKTQPMFQRAAPEWHPIEQLYKGIGAIRGKPYDWDAKNFGQAYQTNVLEDNHPLLEETYKKKGREGLREKIINLLLEGMQPAKGRPKLYVMAGGAASGKGSTIDQAIHAGLIDEKFVYLNPDDAKAQIDEYKQLLELKDWRASSVVHEESSLIVKEAVRRAREAKANVLYDFVMGTQSALDKVKQFKDAGYEITIIGVTIPVEEAIVRAGLRYEEEFRFVPFEILIKGHQGYTELEPKAMELADRFYLYDNMTEKDEPAMLIAYKGEDGQLHILDEERYESHREKEKLDVTAETLTELTRFYKLKDKGSKDSGVRSETEGVVERGGPGQADQAQAEGGTRGNEGRPQAAGEKLSGASEKATVVPFSKTLGVPREAMPQIASKDVPRFIKFLESHGIKVTREQVPLKDIIPSQYGKTVEKVEGLIRKEKNALKDTGEGFLTRLPIIVSQNYGLVDGHHRYAAALELDPEAKINTVRVHTHSVNVIITMARAFDGTTFSSSTHLNKFDKASRFIPDPAGLSFMRTPIQSMKAKEPAPGRMTTASRRLVKALEMEIGDTLAEDTILQVDVAPELAGQVKAIKRIFGKNVVVFQRNPEALFGPGAGNLFGFEGVVINGNTIYVNETLENPFTATVFHELLHQLRMNSPDLYRELARSAIESTTKERFVTFRDALNRMTDSNQERRLNNDLVLEELVADTVADAFLDPAFLQDLAQREPSKFQQIKDAILEYLDKLLTELRGKNMGTSRFYKDIDGLRATMVDVFDRYAKTQAKGKPGTRRVIPQAFHGTPRQNDLSKGFKLANEDDGIYFTSDPEHASGFTIEARNQERDKAFAGTDQTGAVYPTRLTFENPLVIGEDQRDKFMNREFSRKQLLADGHDGVILEYDDGSAEYMILEPSQARSAFEVAFSRAGKTWYHGTDTLTSRDQVEDGELFFTETEEDAKFYGPEVFQAAPKIDYLRTIAVPKEIAADVDPTEYWDNIGDSAEWFDKDGRQYDAIEVTSENYPNMLVVNTERVRFQRPLYTLPDTPAERVDSVEPEDILGKPWEKGHVVYTLPDTPAERVDSVEPEDLLKSIKVFNNNMPKHALFQIPTWNLGEDIDPDAIRFSFGGINAQTADLKKLERAQEMARKSILETGKGFDIKSDAARKIWKETGWFMMPDNNWRFEISDNRTELKHLNGLKNEYELSLDSKRAHEVLEAPDLFAAYPALRQVNLSYHQRSAPQGMTLASTIDGQPLARLTKIMVTQDMKPETEWDVSNLLDTLAHEHQHVIQRSFEKFATGGNPAEQQYEFADPDFMKDVDVAWREAEKSVPDVVAAWLEIEDNDIELQRKYWDPEMDLERFYSLDNRGGMKATVNSIDKEERDKREALHDKFYEAFFAMDEAQRKTWSKAVDYRSQFFGEYGRGAVLDPGRVYWRLHGEVEARLVQRRRGQSDERNKSAYPLDQLDVAVDEMLVRFQRSIDPVAQRYYESVADEKRLAVHLTDNQAKAIRSLVLKQQQMYRGNQVLNDLALAIQERAFPMRFRNRVAYRIPFSAVPATIRIIREGLPEQSAGMRTSLQEILDHIGTWSNRIPELRQARTDYELGLVDDQMAGKAKMETEGEPTRPIEGQLPLFSRSVDSKEGVAGFLKELEATDFGDVEVEAMENFHGDGIELDNIEVIGEPGKGAGSAALKKVLDLADKHQVSLTGYVLPHGKANMSRAALLKWYERNGFEYDEAEAEAALHDLEEQLTIWRNPNAPKFSRSRLDVAKAILAATNGRGMLHELMGPRHRFTRSNLLAEIRDVDYDRIGISQAGINTLEAEAQAFFGIEPQGKGRSEATVRQELWSAIRAAAAGKAIEQPGLIEGPNSGDLLAAAIRDVDNRLSGKDRKYVEMDEGTGDLFSQDPTTKGQQELRFKRTVADLVDAGVPIASAVAATSLHAPFFMMNDIVNELRKTVAPALWTRLDSQFKNVEVAESTNRNDARFQRSREQTGERQIPNPFSARTESTPAQDAFMNEYAKGSLPMIALGVKLPDGTSYTAHEYALKMQDNPRWIDGRTRTFFDREKGFYPVQMEIERRGKDIYLSSLKVWKEYAGQGYGSYILNWLTEMADKHGVRLLGHVQPFDHKALNTKQLKSWYVRHGFKVKGNEITRDPKGPPMDTELLAKYQRSGFYPGKRQPLKVAGKEIQQPAGDYIRYQREKADGNCFPVAAQIVNGWGRTKPVLEARKRIKAAGLDNLHVVHGIVTRPTDGLEHWHAWVEGEKKMTFQGQEFTVVTAIDFSNGNEAVLPQEVYYLLGGVKYVARYDKDKAINKLATIGHYGPWDRPEVGDVMFQRSQAMDLESRMERARAQGFNTDMTLYRGTVLSGQDVTTGQAGLVFLSENESYAKNYAGPKGEVGTFYIRSEKPANLDTDAVARKRIIKIFNDNGGWSENEDVMDERDNADFDPALDTMYEVVSSSATGAADELMEKYGYDSIVFDEGINGKAITHAVRSAEQIRPADDSFTKTATAEDKRQIRLKMQKLRLDSLHYQRSRPDNFSNWTLPSMTLRQALHADDMTMWQKLDQGTRRVRMDVRQELQDRMIPLRAIINAIKDSGATIEDFKNVYERESLIYGRVGDRFEQLEREVIAPMMELAARNNISNADIGEYLYALHAPSRNARIRERSQYVLNEKGQMVPEQDAGSGMSDEEAAGIVKKVESGPNAKVFKKLVSYARQITEMTKENYRDYGLVMPEVLDSWETKEEFNDTYVPLKGWEEAPENERYGSVGKGLDIRGQEVRMALGRRSRPSDILSNITADYKASLIRGEKNAIGRGLYELAREFKNPNLWEVGTFKMRKEYDKKTGMIVEKIDLGEIRNADEVFMLKIDGKAKWVRLKDPRLLKAMKNMGAEQLDVVTRQFARLNRWLSIANTMYNPEFIISNFAKDLQTAAIRLTSQELQDIRKKAINPKAITHAIAAMYRELHDTADKANTPAAREYSKFAREFKEDGAHTDYFRQMSIEDYAKNLDKVLGQFKKGPWGSTKRGARWVKSIVEDANGAVENGVRMSVYMQLRKAKVSRQKAAAAAKNLTVNFNRKGVKGAFINSYMLFYNAGIQGVQLAGTTLKSKTGRRAWYSIGVAGAIMSMWNMLLGGDDEDGTPYYSKVSDYERERNWIFMIPPQVLEYLDKSNLPLLHKILEDGQDTGGRYFKFPLPWVYNIPYVMGDAVVNTTMFNETPGEAASRVLLAVNNSVNPLGESSLMGTIIPTALDPWYQVVQNENFWGGRIWKEDPYGNAPESSDAYPGTGQVWREMAELANRLGGGDRWHASKFTDVHPETLRHWYQTFTGGAGAFVNRVYENATAALYGVDVPFAGDEPLKPERTIFLRKVYGRVWDQADSEIYYQHREALQALESEYKDRKEWAREGRDERAIFKEFAKDNRDVMGTGSHKKVSGRCIYRGGGLLADLKAADCKLGRLRDDRKALRLKEQTPKVKERIRVTQDKMLGVQRDFNKRYNELFLEESWFQKLLEED